MVDLSLVVSLVNRVKCIIKNVLSFTRENWTKKKKEKNSRFKSPTIGIETYPWIAINVDRITKSNRKDSKFRCFHLLFYTFSFARIFFALTHRDKSWLNDFCQSWGKLWLEAARIWNDSGGKFLFIRVERILLFSPRCKELIFGWSKFKSFRETNSRQI